MPLYTPGPPPFTGPQKSAPLTVPTGMFVLHGKRITQTGTARITLKGTSRLILVG